MEVKKSIQQQNFENAVLNSLVYFDMAAHGEETRECSFCGDKFTPKDNEWTCSPFCEENLLK